MVNTIKDFAEWLNIYNGNILDDEVFEIIESKGWYELIIEDSLNEECTLSSVCSDGKDMIVYNSETEAFSVVPDNQIREKAVEREIPHKEKVTDVNFKSITGRDICVRVKRVWEPGNDVSFLEVSIDGGKFYSDISSCTTRDAQIFYVINDEELQGPNRIIIPDDVYCKIMFLRTEEIVETRGSFNDILLSEVKEYIKEGFVLPKAEIKKAADEQGVKFMFPYSYSDESEMSRLSAFNHLQEHHARGLNGNYRGYMIAEYVDVIKKIYPNEF